MSKPQPDQSDGSSPTSEDQTEYPDRHRETTCPSPPQSKSYEMLQVIGKGPIKVVRDVALADPQEFNIRDRTAATVETQIREFQEFDSFLTHSGKLQKETAVHQLAAYPSTAKVAPIEIEEWQIEFRGTVDGWEAVAHDAAENDGYNRATPGLAVQKLRSFVGSGLTDDSAVFAVLNLVDKHELDVSWDREKFLERAVE